MKRSLCLLISISLIFLCLTGCNKGTSRETATTEPTAVATPSPKPSPTPRPTPTPKTLVEEAVDTARRDRDLEDRIEAVEYLIENDIEKGLTSGHEVIASINFRTDDFWEFLDEEHDASNRFLSILTVLNNEGHEDAVYKMAENLYLATDWWRGHEEKDIIMRLLRKREWFELLTVPLADSGWFEEIVFAERELQIRINLYISNDDIDTSLTSIKYLNEDISPSLGDIFYSHDGIVIYPDLDIYASFDESLPILGNDLKSENLDNAKFLMIFRDLKPSMDSPRVYIQLGWQTFIPGKYSPNSMDEVTHIILVDTTYEYYATYNNQVTKAYKSISSMNVYNFESGELVFKTSGTAITTPPSNITYSGSAPEAKYAGTNTNKIFMIFYEEILGSI